MAMRRTSWIDQRINDGVAVLLCLPWFGVVFFLAAADWRDGGLPPSWRRRASPGKRGDANRCDRGSPAAAKGQDRQRPLPASNQFYVAHLRADLPKTSLHSSQHALA